jgi:uncharacterized protein YbjT (DUF2867 family)
MRVLLLGATGHTGTHVVDIALSRGFAVTAFVRSPQKITRADARLAKVQGDPQDSAVLSAALAGHDAIVSTLGPSVRETLGRSSRMTDWGAALATAMTASKVRRLGILSAAVLFPLRGAQYAFFRWLLRHHARDLTEMERLVRTASPECTVVRPPRLVESPEERYVAQPGALPETSSTASFRAVAKFLVDAIEGRRYVGEIVGLVGVR